MVEWLDTGIEDDMRHRMFAASAAGRPFALATIIAADGGPRPIGSQMVVTSEEMWGFLSGGCIEADVALHAREVLAEGAPRVLVYGRGSPFIDMRLPCGGRLEIFVERVMPDEEAVTRLRALTDRRAPALWESNGRERSCRAEEEEDFLADVSVRRTYYPEQRLAVVGSDPFALAIAALGARIGWDTVLLAPFGPATAPPFAMRCDRRPIGQALEALQPDPWTAIAVATHDLDLDQEALLAALRSNAGYVGVLGSRRRLRDRIDGLRRAGLASAEIERLRAPIGLPIRARSPWEVAIAVAGEVIAWKNEPGSHSLPAQDPAERAAFVH